VGEYPQQFEPRSGERLFRHSVARMTSKSQATAFGRGYILSPLTRLKALFNSFTPSMTARDLLQSARSA